MSDNDTITFSGTFHHRAGCRLAVLQFVTDSSFLKHRREKKECKVDDLLNPRGAHVGERTNVKNVVKAKKVLFPTAHDADPPRSTEVSLLRSSPILESHATRTPLTSQRLISR
jgi:hypothetical protein